MPQSPQSTRYSHLRRRVFIVTCPGTDFFTDNQTILQRQNTKKKQNAVERKLTEDWGHTEPGLVAFYDIRPGCRTYSFFDGQSTEALIKKGLADNRRALIGNGENGVTDESAACEMMPQEVFHRSISGQR